MSQLATAFASVTGGSGRVVAFVAPVAETTRQLSVSPIAAARSLASAATGTSRRKFTPVSSASKTLQDASTTPFVATAWIVTSSSPVRTSWR